GIGEAPERDQHGPAMDVVRRLPALCARRPHADPGRARFLASGARQASRGAGGRGVPELSRRRGVRKNGLWLSGLRAGRPGTALRTATKDGRQGHRALYFRLAPSETHGACAMTTLAESGSLTG